MKLIAKSIPYVAVIISLFAGYLTFQRVNPDAFKKKEGLPVTIIDTAAGVYLTIMLYVLNQDPKYLLPEIVQGINDNGEILQSAIKQTQYPVILKIGEEIITDVDNGNGGGTVQSSAKCEKWDLSNKANPITALGEPYYDGKFFCSENNMQDILDLFDNILNK